MTLLGHGHKSAEQQEELREARRILRDRIRDDWDYPALPQWQTPPKRPRDEGEETVAGFRFHASHDHNNDVDFEVKRWQEREYSDDSESEEDTPKSATSKSSRNSKATKWRFEAPDSVGAQVSDRRLARRRKRQEQLEQEMDWNDGLRHWTARRDVWAGAKTASQVSALEAEQHHTQHEVSSAASRSASAGSSPRTSTSSVASAHSSTHHSAPTSSSAATTPDPTPTSHLTSPHPPTTSPSTTNSPTPTLIPVTSLILPNHPIRRRISPSMYTEIYSKIILQSRTPSIPINLCTLVAALVQGWKDDGEWPPKSGPVEPSIGKKKGVGVSREKEEGGFRHGVKAVGRVLRLTGTGTHGEGREKEEG